MYKTQIYNPIGQGTFNPDATLKLSAFNVEPLAQSLSTAGGLKIVRNMTAVGTDGKLIKRSKLLTGAASGDTSIYVTNPWAFSVGDAIRVIAVPNTAPAVELAAITGATGASLGTIASIEGSIDTQACRITLAAAVVGNIITVDFKGVAASYTIATATLADELTALATTINKAIFRCDTLRYVEAKSMGTTLAIVSTQTKQIVEFTASISQGVSASLAAMTTSTDAGLGRLTLSAPLAAALTQGTKIGTVTQTPLGIFDGEHDFTDYLHTITHEHAITPAYAGHFYLDGMSYIDGQITSVLNQAKFI